MTNKSSATGTSVAEALDKIAKELDVKRSDLDFEVQRDQFFTSDGQARGLTEMIVSGWLGVKAEGVDEMIKWLSKTLELMSFTAKVSGSDKNGVRFTIDSEEGGRIIGRKGSTLRSIQTLMTAAAKAKGFDWEYSINVSGGEKKEERERRPRRERDDRPRGPRKSSKRDEEKLQELAKKLAEKVIKESTAIVIEKELNGFQRRVVHLAIKEIEGVGSESFMDNDIKKIRLTLTSA